jgi:nicotinamidase/pyrazinamidase
MNDAGGALVLFDVDTQVDFMYPAGKLYVPGAEQIVPKLDILMKWARANDIPVVSTSDAHQADDPEFKSWPPHCVVGTGGQRRIPETLFPMPTVIPARPGAFKPPNRWRGQFIVEKPTYTPEDNPNFAAFLGALSSRRAIVCGVATEFCVRAVVLALRKQGFEVDVVTDAIKPITDEGGRTACAEMTAAGARMVTVATVCNHAIAEVQTP